MATVFETSLHILCVTLLVFVPASVLVLAMCACGCWCCPKVRIHPLKDAQAVQIVEAIGKEVHVQVSHTLCLKAR